jgi:hypothetical protein
MATRTEARQRRVISTTADPRGESMVLEQFAADIAASITSAFAESLPLRDAGATLQAFTNRVEEQGRKARKPHVREAMRLLAEELMALGH